MKTRKVTISDYDPSWPAGFGKLKARLMNTGCFLRVEHVGSTAVPGLAAKPIIDLDAVISDGAELDPVKEKLAELGYTCEGELGIPGRIAFAYEALPEELTAHHLYVCRESGAELARHIALRDWLRSHPDDAEEYGMIKKAAALAHSDDIDAYIKEKTPFIERTFIKAGITPEN